MGKLISKLENSLIISIHQNFMKADRPCPDEITCHSCPECDDIRDSLSSFSNQELPDNIISEHQSALANLTPKAFRYYLPSYMAYGIHHKDEFAFDAVLFNLSPENVDDNFKRRMHQFTKREIDTIIKYLEYRKTVETDAEFDINDIIRGIKIWSEHLL